MLATLTLALLTLSASATLQERRPADPFEGLADLVHAERRARQLPGLAAVIVRSDGTPRVYVSGERRIGQGDPITPGDRMHLGSLTKAITATLIGALVEKGRMTYETTLGQIFAELSPKMQPAYRAVTVRQLLTHAAGLPAYGTNVSMLPLLALTGTPREQRYAFVERVLADPPEFEPGTRFEYSNAGAAVAAAMAERIADASYSQLVEQLVFAPIGARAAFGNPGLAGEPQPLGHKRTMFGTIPVLPANPLHTTPPAIEPAGDASPSMPDYGRFLQLHLRGLRGRDDGLKSRTILELHGKETPGHPRRGPALGWTVMPREGGASHEHRGSNGAYVAFVSVQPSCDVAVAVFTNIGGEGLREAVAGIALRIASRFATPAKGG